MAERRVTPFEENLEQGVMPPHTAPARSVDVTQGAEPIRTVTEVDDVDLDKVPFSSLHGFHVRDVPPPPPQVSGRPRPRLRSREEQELRQFAQRQKAAPFRFGQPQAIEPFEKTLGRSIQQNQFRGGGPRFRETDEQRDRRLGIATMRAATPSEMAEDELTRQAAAKQREVGAGQYSLINEGLIRARQQLSVLRAGAYRRMGRPDWAQQELDEVAKADRILSGVAQLGEQREWLFRNITPNVLPVLVQYGLLKGTGAGLMGYGALTSGLTASAISDDPATIAGASVVGGLGGGALKGATRIQNPLLRVGAGAAAGAAGPTGVRTILGAETTPGQALGEAVFGGLAAARYQPRPTYPEFPAPPKEIGAGARGISAGPPPGLGGPPSAGPPGTLRAPSQALMRAQQGRLALEPTPIERAVGPSPFAGEPRTQFPLTDYIKGRIPPNEQALALTDPATGLPLLPGDRQLGWDSVEAWKQGMRTTPGSMTRLADDPYLQEIEALQQSALAKMGLENTPERALDMVNLYEESITRPLPYKAKQYQQAWDAMALLDPLELGAMAEFGRPLGDPQFPGRDLGKYQGPGLADYQIANLPMGVAQESGRIPTAAGSIDVDIVRSESLMKDLTGDKTPTGLPGPAFNKESIGVVWSGAPSDVKFKSPKHYGDVENVLYEVTVDERNTVEGNRALVGTELQSDFFQSGDARASHPLGKDWVARAVDTLIAEARKRGVDGILVPTTPEMVYRIQGWGTPMKDEKGKYVTYSGKNVNPIVERYVKDVAKQLKQRAQQMGVQLGSQSVTLDRFTGETAPMTWLPMPAQGSTPGVEAGIFSDFFKDMFGDDPEPGYRMITPKGDRGPALLEMPDSVLKILSPRTGGFRTSIDNFTKMVLQAAKDEKLSPKETNELVKYSTDLINENMRRGVRSVAVQKAGMEPEPAQGIVQHETYHMGEGQLLPPGVDSLMYVHDQKWAASHPAVIKALTSRDGRELSHAAMIEFLAGKAKAGEPGAKELLDVYKQVPPAQRMAYELPAYLNQGPSTGYDFGLTEAEQWDYMADRLNHLIDKWGPSALDIVAETAVLRPEVEELFTKVKGERGVETGNLGLTGSGSDPGYGIRPTGAQAQPQRQGGAQGIGRAVEGGRPRATGSGSLLGAGFGSGIEYAEQPTGARGLELGVSEGGPLAVRRGDAALINRLRVENPSLARTIESELYAYAGRSLTDQEINNEIENAIRGRGALGSSDLVQELKQTLPPVFEGLTEEELARRDRESLDAIRSPIEERQEFNPAAVELAMDPIFKDQVDPTHIEAAAAAFRQLLEEQGLKLDPTVRPFLQVHKALIEGKIQPGRIEPILEANRMSWRDFADAFKASVSDAGRALAYLRWIDGRWTKLEKEDPGLAKRLKPAKERAEIVRRDIERTILGKNLWKRSGGLIQKMMLTQMATTITNDIMTTAMIPMFASYQSLGAWMKTMVEGEGSLKENLAQANSDALDGAMASFDVVRALNPRQLKELLAGVGLHDRPGKLIPKGIHLGKGSEYLEFQNVVRELEKSFPDLHRKMQSLSTGTETLEKGTESLNILKQISAEIEDPVERGKVLDQIAKYDTRLKSDLKGLGKVMGGAEWFYDLLLKPMSWSEYMFRRPMFVGQLKLELKRQGVDLNNVLASGSFSDIPYESMETAVNKALEFTYAYDPAEDGPAFERAGAQMIQLMNTLGPVSYLTGTMFPRAMYNGMKFMMEWSPIGAFAPGTDAPGSKIFRRKFVPDPVTGEPYRVDRPGQKDWDRMAKAMIGTMMMGLAWGLRELVGGDEWWQIKSGRTSPDGRPIYIDIRKWKPISEFMRIADLVDRAYKGTLGDIDLKKQMIEAATGVRTVPEQPQTGEQIQDYMDAMTDWYGDGNPNPTTMKLQEDVGRFISVPLTPLLNLRDLYAQFSEAENVKLDVRGKGFTGPMLDKLPWLRAKYLPQLTSPTEPSPIGISDQPGIAQFGGLKMVAGENFAGREWRRLGLANRTFLPRDPDPVINREQNRIFQHMIGKFGERFAQDPSYLNANDSMKAARWEQLIGGDDGLKAFVKEMAVQANPREAQRREALGQMPGPMQRKAYGLDKKLEEIKGGK